jgi:ankyrin repeat protein
MTTFPPSNTWAGIFFAETPFHRAASRGRQKVIAFLSKKLRECNADPLKLNPDWDHMTPLNRAAENGFDRVVEEILEIYEVTATPVEKIFMADCNGMNPLHLGCSKRPCSSTAHDL